jgi:hypothetical protein
MSTINIKDIIEWNDVQLSEAYSIETLNILKKKVDDELMKTMAKNASAHLDMGDPNLYGKDMDKLRWLLNKFERAIEIKLSRVRSKPINHDKDTANERDR